jgi:hypothetical protein
MVRKKGSKIILTMVILIVVIIVVLHYTLMIKNIMNEEQHETIDENGNEINSHNKAYFSISAEKYEFALQESINITFCFYNGNNVTIEIGNYLMGGSLQLHLWDSMGHEIIMYPYSIPGSLRKKIVLGPGGRYEESYDIERHFGSYKNENNTYSIDDRFRFHEGNFLFNATYVNFHAHDSNLNWSNQTIYLSNTIEFEIV